MDGASDVATQRYAASEHLIERLSGSDDPVLAYKAGLLAGMSSDSAQARALQTRIPGSPTARALLRVFQQDEKTLHHVYRKWPALDVDLSCPSRLPARRLGVAAVGAPRLRLAFLPALHGVAPDRDLPWPGRPGPPLRLDGRQRDLVLRPARAGGRTHSRRSTD